MGRIKEVIKSKKYLLIYEVGRDPVSKSRKRKSETFYGTKKEAELELARLELEFDQGHSLDVDNLTVGEYFLTWMETFGKNKLATSTLRRYYQCINYRIIPWIGHIELKKLRKLHLQQFYQRMIDEGCMHSGKPANPKRKKKKSDQESEKRPISNGSIEYHHRVIHRILEAACEQEILLRNVSDKISLPEVEEDFEDEKVEFLTHEQVKELERRTPETPYYVLCFLAVRTGLRRGELLGLRWCDIDFDRLTLTVARALGHDGTYFKKPKNNKKRTIQITKEVVNVLRQHRLEQRKLNLRKGKGKDEEKEKEQLVFCLPSDKPLVPDTVSSWFPDFCEKIGLKRFHFHCLRHTHASLLLANGEDLHFVSKRLGHSSIRITADIYGHLVPKRESSAIKKLEKSLKI